MSASFVATEGKSSTLHTKHLIKQEAHNHHFAALSYKPTLQPATDCWMLNRLYSLGNVHEVKQFIHNIEFWLNSIPSGVYIVARFPYRYTYDVIWNLEREVLVWKLAAERVCVMRSIKFNEIEKEH